MRRQRPTFRRGVTAMLAMMYLGLFSTLAIGFYATVTTAAQIAGNDQRATGARMAAESGMQFMKYHLANLNIPAGTPKELLFQETYNRLSARLNGTANMGGRAVGASPDGTRILIPGPTSAFIVTDKARGLEFRAEVTPDEAERVIVTVVGRENGKQSVTSELRGARGVQLKYGVDKNSADIFEFGVASKSAISLEGSVSVTGTPGNDHMGSVLSTTSASTPVRMSGQSRISGDLTYVNGNISVGANCYVGNVKPTNVTEFAKHVHRTSTPPEFPIIDTTPFVGFAPAKGSAPNGTNVLNTSNPAGGTYTNIRIVAGSNPTFASHTTLQGVIVVEHPNQVSFTADCTIKGVIVSECGPADNNNSALVAADMGVAPTGDLDIDSFISFAGNVQAFPVERLDPAQFPQELRDLTGSLMIVPGFRAQMTGTFGTVTGSIIASGLEFSGNAGGVIKGSIICLEDSQLTLKGNNTIVIESQGASNYPAGILFGSHYDPYRGSYKEVRP